MVHLFIRELDNFFIGHIVWDQVKNLDKIKVGDIHSSILIHSANCFIAEGNHVGQVQLNLSNSVLAFSSHLLIFQGPERSFPEDVFFSFPNNWSKGDCLHFLWALFFSQYL